MSMLDNNVVDIKLRIGQQQVISYSDAVKADIMNLYDRMDVDTKACFT
jgi:hypothetical protein